MPGPPTGKGLGYLNPPGLADPGPSGIFLPGGRRASGLRARASYRSPRGARLRWNPYQLRLASLLTNNWTDRSTFRVPVAFARRRSVTPLSSVTTRGATTPVSICGRSIPLVARADYSCTPGSSELRRHHESRPRASKGSGCPSSAGMPGSERTCSAQHRGERLSRHRELVSPGRATWSSTFCLQPGSRRPHPVREGGDSTGGFIAPHTPGELASAGVRGHRRPGGADSRARERREPSPTSRGWCSPPILLLALNTARASTALPFRRPSLSARPPGSIDDFRRRRKASSRPALPSCVLTAAAVSSCPSA